MSVKTFAGSCRLLGQNINACFCSWESKNMVEATWKCIKKLVNLLRIMLSHTIKGKTLLYYPQYWVILMFWEINEELQFSVLVRKPVAAFSNNLATGNIGLNLLLLPDQHF